ncbi:hypothetical protein CRG98_009852 [Punica granatum]|uniref:Uncharacterized protein n=1 Tax=Punica granatum TaxID=22663 RepID=A0A2I0KPF2_PUNGR|nr:hypothetical protein CRG98_009852 [Punica granatum]
MHASLFTAIYTYQRTLRIMYTCGCIRAFRLTRSNNDLSLSLSPPLSLSLGAFQWNARVFTLVSDAASNRQRRGGETPRAVASLKRETIGRLPSDGP